jgi:small-conductance mechanosensitive channel
MELFEAMESNFVQMARVSGASLGILFGALLAYLFLVRGLRILAGRRYLPAQLVDTLRRVVFWLVALTAILIFLQSLGVLQSVLAAVTGVFALLAIGFVAVWSVLSNTLCSLMLMIVRPFRVGDSLAFPPDDLRGKVVNFNMLFTTLETDEGLLLQVPNNMFFQRPIVRKKGKWHVGLADQLYEKEDATAPIAPKNAGNSSDTQRAA